MQTFISKNKVVIAAFLGALVLVLQQALQTRETSLKAIAYAAFIALLGVAAKQWKGQGLTIFGMISSVAGVAHTLITTNTFTWNEFVLSIAYSFLLAVLGSLQPKEVKPF